ncbi:MAG TPA: Calx-beta domain-containing protein [Thermoanaerobaculia bacterium]|nr:Calx-beta domain-containing protein [Thermoanaerobaculia bacterium]
MRSHFSMSPRQLAVLCGALALALASAARAANYTVTATAQLTFVPQDLTINVGDSVTWTNSSGITHNVAADDGSFRCANGCDGQGGDGTPAGNWTFTRVFNQAGTVAYHCQVHGTYYGHMVGSIVVRSASSPGMLGFTSTSYSQPETGGHATITVQRSAGGSGTVTVDYATSDGSAVAGKNYTPASGTLSWGDGDTSQKSFEVPVLDDGVQDGTHTVNLMLSNPTGGATLGQSAAVLSVTDNDRPASAGALAFASAAYSVGENAGSVPITVNRSGGGSGAVSVHYATSDGTGVAGKNYTASSGTLNWGDADTAAKTFTVAVLDDGVADGNHSVNLTLSAPKGGASLGTRAAAVLTVTDTDGNNGSPPAAPSDLTATGTDTTDILLNWKSNSTNEADFRVQSKPLDGSPFQDVLPLVPAGTTSLTVSALKPATGYGFRVRAENGSGNSSYTSEADAATAASPGPCIADANTLCLGAGGRFKATVAWATADGKSGMGTVISLPSNPDSGLFYFFGPNNIEMLIKVLNACVPFNGYWVFFAATTNVQITVTVVDTKSGQTRVYFNQVNQAALPVQDTGAFATCP